MKSTILQKLLNRFKAPVNTIDVSSTNENSSEEEKSIKAAEANFKLGNNFFYQNKYEEALTAYQCALAINSNYPDAYNMLGISYYELNKIEEGITAFQTAIALNPNNYVYYINLALALFKQKNYQGALQMYEYADSLQPNCGQILTGIGGCLENLFRFDEAIIVLKRAIELEPKELTAYINLSGVYVNKGCPLEGIAVLEAAKNIDPDSIKYNSSYGSTLYFNERIEESIIFLERAIAKAPASEFHPRWICALAYLKLGNYKKGWPYYEARWDHDVIQTNAYVTRYKSFRRWKPGEEIQGKKIMLICEQGYGDSIQFVRYIPQLAQLGVTVMLDCHKVLKTLFQSIPGLSQVITPEEEIPSFDMYCSLLSLPLLFGTMVDTIPPPIPYINPNQRLVEKWQAQMANNNELLKVGLVWSGTDAKGTDVGHVSLYRRRNLKLDYFAPLGKIKGVQFYSLQKGESAQEVKKPPANLNIIDYTNEFNDFLDTAAFISSLDLIISVDTAVVHLASTMGKPVWMLNRYAGCWRWFNNRTDSPWYPTVRLFNQVKINEWEPVIEEIAQALQEYKNNFVNYQCSSLPKTAILTD